MREWVESIINLDELASQLRLLSAMTEWEYPLSWQGDIDKVIHIINTIQSARKSSADGHNDTKE